MPHLIVDGWNAGHPGSGLAAYAGRLVRAMLARPSALGCPIRVAFPRWYGRQDLGFDLGANAVFLRSVRTGHPLLDEILWKNRLGYWSRASGHILFSPGPFWSPAAPEKCVVAFHDCIYRHFPHYQGTRAIRKWYLSRTEAFLGRCAAVITQSESSRREIVDLLRVEASRIDVIPAWLPPEYSPAPARAGAPAVRRRYALPPRFWLYVGGFDYR